MADSLPRVILIDLLERLVSVRKFKNAAFLGEFRQVQSSLR